MRTSLKASRYCLSQFVTCNKQVSITLRSLSSVPAGQLKSRILPKNVSNRKKLCENFRVSIGESRRNSYENKLIPQGKSLESTIEKKFGSFDTQWMLKFVEQT